MPPASNAFAVSLVEPPTTRPNVDGVTRRSAIGDGATVIDAVPTLPSLVTVIVAAPGALTVTLPSLETCATLTFELL